jgi:hypothetical protein
MNHCIDVICSSCGHIYCLLGCNLTKDSYEPERMIEALERCHQRGTKPFHYKHNVCRNCGQQTVFDIPPSFYSTVSTILNEKKTAPAGQQEQ